MSLCRRFALAMLLVPLRLSALSAAQDIFTIQAPPARTAPVTGYPVTGHVVCADTQRPARFAQVQLIPAGSTGDGGFRGSFGRTDLDGNFVLANVAPGDYYAVASIPGYVNLAPAIRNALQQGGDALAALTGLTRVQVSTGGGSAQVVLQRGAVLSGSIQWDDGSPAAGVQVTAQPSTGTSAASGGNLNSLNGFGPRSGPGGAGGQTDDRGRFRLSGLAPGSYLLRASVQSPLPQAPADGRANRLTTLSVYAPNKLRRTDATVFTLTAGEERSDLSVVLGLAGMHTVSGDVSSSGASVHSGSVSLTDQIDSSLSRDGFINADGSFSVAYVPAGTYTLQVNASTETAGRGAGGGDGSVHFQPVQASVTVTDSDVGGLHIAVQPAGSQ